MFKTNYCLKKDEDGLFVIPASLVHEIRLHYAKGWNGDNSWFTLDNWFYQVGVSAHVLLVIYLILVFFTT